MISKRARKDIISYCLAFLLMLSIVSISLIALLKYSMFSMRAVEYTCNRIEYADDIKEEIKTESYRMGIPFGINKKDLKDVFSNQQIRSDMRKVLQAKVEGEGFMINCEDISRKITENVVKSNGELYAQQKESLDAYISKVVTFYQKKMVIPGIDYIAKGINIFSKIALIGIPVAILLGLLCIFFLISTRKYTYHGLRYVAYGTLGAGITLLSVFAAFISNGFIYKFNISDVYMRKFFTFWIGHEFLVQVFSGIIILLAGAVIIYICVRQKFRMHEE